MNITKRLIWGFNQRHFIDREVGVVSTHNTTKRTPMAGIEFLQPIFTLGELWNRLQAVWWICLIWWNGIPIISCCFSDLFFLLLPYNNWFNWYVVVGSLHWFDDLSDSIAKHLLHRCFDGGGLWEGKLAAELRRPIHTNVQQHQQKDHRVHESHCNAWDGGKSLKKYTGRDLLTLEWIPKVLIPQGPNSDC